MVASLPGCGTEGRWNAIASSIFSDPGRPYFGVALDYAVGAEHSAELDMGKYPYHGAFLYCSTFP